MLNNITTDQSGNLILFGSFTSATMQIGGFVLTNKYSGGVIAQYYVAKVNPSGTVLWAICDGNIISGGFPFFGTTILSIGGVATDTAGNIYIASAFGGSSMTVGSTTLTNADPSGSTYDIFVAKYTPAGVLVWASSIGGKSSDYAFGITVSSTGDVYVAGAFLSPSITIGSSVITNPYKYVSAYIAKFSSTGTPVWGEGAGGANGAFSAGLTSDKTGNVYMAGTFADSSITLGGTTILRTYPAAVPQSALFLVQYSPADVVTFSKTIGSPTSGVLGYTVSLAECGQVWVGGSYSESATIGSGDTLAIGGSAPYWRDPTFIAGYDLSGSVLGYAGLGGGGDDQMGIACDPFGNVFVCGDYFTGFYGDKLIAGPDTLGVVSGSEAFYLAKYGSIADTTYETIRDTIACGTSKLHLRLQAPAGYLYYWNNGNTTDSMIVSSTGKYYVYCRTCGNSVLIDTFDVTIANPGTQYEHIDIEACSSASSTTLNAPPGYLRYYWNSGQTTSSIATTLTGIHIVTSDNACSILVDTFHITVKPTPVVDLGTDTMLCIGDTMIVSPTEPGGVLFQWSTGSTDSFIMVSSPGAYSVVVTENGCSASSIISIKNVVPEISLGNDTTICQGVLLLLPISASEGSITWSNGNIGPTFSPDATGTYWASIANKCGTASDTVHVTFDLCDIWFPSAFTPNNDGKNDIIRVGGSLQDYKEFTFRVFNRYGQNIFYTQNIYAGWDGVYKGTKQDIGTYFYEIFYTLNGTRHMMKGNFELLR